MDSREIDGDDHFDPVYWRIYCSGRDGELGVVCLQSLDEITDYDQSSFLNDTKYTSEEDAQQALVDIAQVNERKLKIYKEGNRTHVFVKIDGRRYHGYGKVLSNALQVLSEAIRHKTATDNPFDRKADEKKKLRIITLPRNVRVYLDVDGSPYRGDGQSLSKALHHLGDAIRGG